MTVLTIGCNFVYAIYVGGKRILDIQDVTHSYPTFLKEGTLKGAVNDGLERSVCVLSNQPDPISKMVAMVIQEHRDAIVDSVYQNVLMQYQEDKDDGT